MPPATATAAVARLRRVAAACRAGAPLAPEDGQALDAAIGEYLAGAAAGVTMDQCLGLAGHGVEPWWTAEARVERDQVLRLAARRLAGGARALDQALQL